MFTITIVPENRIVEAEPGETLLAALHRNGTPVESPCGGQGNCRKCRVEIEYRAPSGNRVKKRVLACRWEVTRDLRVLRIASDGRLDQKAGPGPDVRVPVAHAFSWAVLPSAAIHREEARSGLEGLRRFLGRECAVSLPVLAEVSASMDREEGERHALLEENRLLALRTGQSSLLGTAVDLGTTTIAVYTADLAEGRILDVRSAGNPQATLGADVISRIRAQEEDALKKQWLQESVRETLARLLAEGAREAGGDPGGIAKVVIGGNTVMMHLFLGIPAGSIARAPFAPVCRMPDPLTIRDAGLPGLPDGMVHFLPAIAGYVGGDTTGVILAHRLDRTRKTVLAVDLGTNGEIVLAAGGRLRACAAAAGPAFEGASIHNGMMALPGAIHAVSLAEGRLEVRTVEGAPPAGICGSGLLDAVHALRTAGLLDASGRILSPGAGHPMEETLGRVGGTPAIRLWGEGGRPDRSVWLTQQDVRELQLAKGAVRAGIDILLQEAGISFRELDAVLLAGSFGSEIDPRSALATGLLPGVDPAIVRGVGNSAGMGALLALCSQRERQRARRIAERTGYLELSGNGAFGSVFARRMRLAPD